VIRETVVKKEKEEKNPQGEDQKKKKKLTAQFQKLEEKIASIKTEKEKLELQLSLPDIYNDPKKFQETLSRFGTVEKELTVINAEWEKIFEELEGMN
jgi:ATP-binding cassette subfamily F protein 3